MRLWSSPMRAVRERPGLQSHVTCRPQRCGVGLNAYMHRKWTAPAIAHHRKCAAAVAGYEDQRKLLQPRRTLMDIAKRLVPPRTLTAGPRSSQPLVEVKADSSASIIPCGGSRGGSYKCCNVFALWTLWLYHLTHRLPSRNHAIGALA